MDFKFCFLVLFLISTVTEGSNNIGSLSTHIRNKINQKRSGHQNELDMLRETRHMLLQRIVAIEEEAVTGGLEDNPRIASMLEELFQTAARMIGTQQTTENESNENSSSTQSTENTTPESTATPTSDTTEHSTSETTEHSTSETTEHSTSETTEHSTSETTEHSTSETTNAQTAETTEGPTTTQTDKRLIQLEEDLVRELFLKKLKESLRNK